MDRVEDLLDGTGLALGLEDARLGRPLRAKDLGLLLALGVEDRGLLDALGGEDDGAAVPLGAHLLLHRVLDRGRRVDRLDLDPVDPHAPAPGGVVEHAAQLGVDPVAAGEGLLEVERADDITQRGHSELLDALDEVGNLVDRRLGVGHLEIEHGVDADDEVVRGDDRLGREGHHLLSQVDIGPDLVDEGDEQVQARSEGPRVRPQPLDDDRRLLGDDPHRPDDDDDGEEEDEEQHHDSGVDLHEQAPFCKSRTGIPEGMSVRRPSRRRLLSPRRPRRRRLSCPAGSEPRGLRRERSIAPQRA